MEMLISVPGTCQLPQVYVQSGVTESAGFSAKKKQHNELFCAALEPIELC